MTPALVIIAFLGGLCAATIAAGKGRNPIGWLVIGMMFPVLSVVLAIVLPEVNKLEKALASD